MASSSSRVRDRVAFPCHGLEALFSFDVCVSEAAPFIQEHSCRPWVHSRSALPVSTDTNFGRDKPFCFPCIPPLRVVVSSPAVLLPCSCRCLVCAHALPWRRWILMFPSALRRWPLCHSRRAGFAKVYVRLVFGCRLSGTGLCMGLCPAWARPGTRPAGQLAPSPAGRGGQCFSRCVNITTPSVNKSAIK